TQQSQLSKFDIKPIVWYNGRMGIRPEREGDTMDGQGSFSALVRIAQRERPGGGNVQSFQVAQQASNQQQPAPLNLREQARDYKDPSPYWDGDREAIDDDEENRSLRPRAPARGHHF